MRRTNFLETNREDVRSGVYGAYPVTQLGVVEGVGIELVNVPCPAYHAQRILLHRGCVPTVRFESSPLPLCLWSCGDHGSWSGLWRKEGEIEQELKVVCFFNQLDE